MNYETPASKEIVEKTIAGLKLRNILGELAETKETALARIKELIPAGASVYTGASVTLEEIGLVEYLKSGQHPWKNTKDAIVAEKDPAKQAHLRREATIADYYLGSVHAITEDGEMLIASNTGSQLPSLIFTSPNVILVIGTQKITPNFTEAMKRLEDHVVPLEDVRMKAAAGVGTRLSKLLIYKYESPFLKRTVRVIFVNGKFGF